MWATGEFAFTVIARLIEFFCFLQFPVGDVKLRHTQIGFNSIGVELDRAVQFRKGLVLLLLSEEHASHQDVAFDVVLILRQNLLGHSFRFSDDVCPTAAAGEIVVTKLDARFEIVLIES